MDAPQYQAPAPDPGLAILQQQSQQQDIKAIQDNVRQDTASLLARYGANLAFAGAMGSAGMAPAAAKAGA